MLFQEAQLQEIQVLVQKWLDIDVNLQTRNQILKLNNDLKSTDNNTVIKSYNKLRELLRTRIVFGTAGLRARMEAGFSRMNDVTVLQASQGLAEYIKFVNNNNKELTVVIGHDHRYNSKRFAELAISVFILKGFKVYYIGPENCATPMVPFAINHFNSLGGIMITASHNPKDDNGYKVYWSNGCQIIPPHDSLIQNKILENLNPILNPSDNWDTNIYVNSKNNILCYNEIVESYEKHLFNILKPSILSNFKYIYTAMHGVGFEFVSNIINTFTLNPKVNFNYVSDQCIPDPSFPTVNFPNPEEKNALDLAISKANELNISLIVANDPDADRFTAAFNDHNNNWRQLSGNELGILFTDFIIQSYIERNEDLSKIYILNSTVSSQMIKSMALKIGFNFQDTLTGFKWIGNKAIELTNKGFTVPFAYEEAIGFMFPTVFDKDGISALIVFLQLYNKLLKLGLTPTEKLEQLYQEYGYFKQCNGYYITPDPLTMNDIFNTIIRIKNVNYEIQKYPTHIGNYKVIYWRDLTTGFQSDTIDNIPELYVDSLSQMTTCNLYNGNEGELVRFTARGSGTEPKLKVYIEAKAANEERSQFLADDVWRTLRDEWFLPEKHNLIEKLV
jgi:phosphoglucomutase